MKLRVLAWAGIAALAIALALGLAAAWMLNTNAGARWTLARVSGLLNDALQIGRVEGTLAGPLILQHVEYRDPRGGLEARVERVDVDVALRKLLALTVHVTKAELRGVEVVLGEPAESAPPAPEGKPFGFEAPIDLIVDRFELRDATVSSAEELIVAIDAASFAGRWIGTALTVRQLHVRSPQGEIHFRAQVHQGRYYEGAGHGRFRWQVGARTFAGSLEGSARQVDANLRLDLTAPMKARLDVALQQLEHLPWQFMLQAPRFDPRDGLSPGSGLQSLAATLSGAGSMREGTVQGVLSFDEEALEIERVHFERDEQALALDALVRFGGGEITAQGSLQTSREPLAGSFNVRWSDLVVPAVLAGQALHTRGAIEVGGSAQQYRATGAVRLGPPDRLADLELDVKGTPQRVQIEQLDIVQTPGRFALRGALDLQPRLAWSLRAQARRFDPGAFAVQWPGSLDFELRSQGTMQEDGPQGTFILSDLQGRLRHRALRGQADLTLSPGWVVAGTLDLTSGASRLQFRGEPGERMDATAIIQVPVLNDWLPDGSGAVHGRIVAQGRWPTLHVDGRVNADALHIGAQLQAETLVLEWRADLPENLAGSATLRATELLTSGLEFAAVNAEVAGDMARHTVDFAARGTPLSAEVFVAGSRAGKGWAGTIDRLVLDVQEAARLALEQPVHVDYSPERIRISPACLADGAVRLCIQGERTAEGALKASYSLQDVPLGLAHAFTPASMPLRFTGTLDGSGMVSSTAEGVFSGRADLRSEHGRIARQAADAQDEDETADVLLTYRDLSLSAVLEGSQAQAELDARLDDDGALQGRVEMSGLAEPVTQLEGALSASLPSLRVVELFAPQLANVQGRADLRASVGGTLDAPRIGGQLRLLELGADIPALGLKLREGSLDVASLDSDRFRIVGGVASGPGRLELEGEATAQGAVQMMITGREFQAADIPSANVLIDPSLDFERSPERMRLTGEVHIPRANINVQKLPRGQSTQGLSPDVVIIDAPEQASAPAEALPLHAEIRVTLGEVELIGFGLEAEVSGQLTVREQPGVPTTGSGEVRVAGTYRAYGQDLTIRQGRLLFAGSPLDDPRLNIVAVRELEEVTAGLQVGGTAQNPQLTVFSEPAMGQAEALALLVTGKPLSEVGQGDPESDMLQSAARSVGAAAGGLLARSVGRRLGVDELTVEDSDALGGAALTVGRYLSPRLYLSYGVGLFEPGEVLTLRYRLSRSLALEAVNAPQDSRAGLEFRMER